MKSIRVTLGERLWELRDEIAELRKERRKVFMDQPLEPEDEEILESLDSRIRELNEAHDLTMRALDLVAAPLED